MTIESELNKAVVNAQPGTLQRQQAEMLMAHFRLALEYGFVDKDYVKDDSEAPFNGETFDQATREGLLDGGFVIFKIKAISYDFFDQETRKFLQVKPREREVAVSGKKHFLEVTRGMLTLEEHLKAVAEFRKVLNGKIRGVNVELADVATYRELERAFDRHFKFRRSFFELDDQAKTRFETFTSSRFGDRIIVIGQHGGGWGTTPTFSEALDPNTLKTNLNAELPSYHRRTFMSIPVVVQAE